MIHLATNLQFVSVTVTDCLCIIGFFKQNIYHFIFILLLADTPQCQNESFLNVIKQFNLSLVNFPTDNWINARSGTTEKIKKSVRLSEETRNHIQYRNLDFWHSN